MNWGNKLILVFVAFAVFMFSMVYKAMHTKFDLVSKAYYEDELRYQDKIDGKQNALSLGKLPIVQQDSVLTIQFPETVNRNTVQGEAWFYCKTDAAKDLRVPLLLNMEGQQEIPLQKLPSHQYQLKLSWVEGDKHYYIEQDIVLN
jgi:hypothetical protein